MTESLRGTGVPKEKHASVSVSLLGVNSADFNNHTPVLIVFVHVCMVYMHINYMGLLLNNLFCDRIQFKANFHLPY